MPTENRPSNTEQMVSVPRELLESIANPRNGFALGDSREQLRDLLAQPAAQHQGEPVAYRWEQLGGAGWCYGEALPPIIIGAWQELYAHPPTTDGFSAGDMADQGAKAFRDGVTACADLIQKRMDGYLSEFGAIDPGTGSVELPRGGDEYVGELQEIIDGIRALPLPR